MDKLPSNLTAKLNSRKQENALRKLPVPGNLIDFSSNDYLGFAKEVKIAARANQLLAHHPASNGSTGSRLITGNHALYKDAENSIAIFYDSQAALLFNSGYDANVGFFGSVPQRGDVVLYDELIHASIRDGLRLSYAKIYKFGHNDIEDLRDLLEKHSAPGKEVYVVTESVFSMDGDTPHLPRIAAICKEKQARLVVDEAHAVGVFGHNGEGLVKEFDLQDQVFARIITFGKALGCHGAAVLCSFELCEYLVNFARSFIYTTGLPPHSIATIIAAHEHLVIPNSSDDLRDNIAYFCQEKAQMGLDPLFVKSRSAIQSAIIPGNDKVRDVACALQQNGFDIRAILSPTVPAGQERLRICLHSFNTKEQIKQVLTGLATAVF
jgi:8-amino-7-oxononanoate synthase